MQLEEPTRIQPSDYSYMVQNAKYVQHTCQPSFVIALCIPPCALFFSRTLRCIYPYCLFVCLFDYLASALQTSIRANLRIASVFREEVGDDEYPFVCVCICLCGYIYRDQTNKSNKDQTATTIVRVYIQLIEQCCRATRLLSSIVSLDTLQYIRRLTFGQFRFRFLFCSNLTSSSRVRLSDCVATFEQTRTQSSSYLYYYRIFLQNT